VVRSGTKTEARDFTLDCLGARLSWDCLGALQAWQHWVENRTRALDDLQYRLRCGRDPISAAAPWAPGLFWVLFWVLFWGLLWDLCWRPSLEMRQDLQSVDNAEP
jgi:hypothetical protein